MDNANPRARAISHFEGHITFISTYCGPAGKCNFERMQQRIRKFADSLAKIRTIGLIRVINPTKASFRVEYSALSGAKTALQYTGVDYKLDVSA